MMDISLDEKLGFIPYRTSPSYTAVSFMMLPFIQDIKRVQ